MEEQEALKKQLQSRHWTFEALPILFGLGGLIGISAILVIILAFHSL